MNFRKQHIASNKAQYFSWLFIYKTSFKNQSLSLIQRIKTNQYKVKLERDVISDIWGIRSSTHEP